MIENDRILESAGMDYRETEDRLKEREQLRPPADFKQQFRFSGDQDEIVAKPTGVKRQLSNNAISNRIETGQISEESKDEED